MLSEDERRLAARAAWDYRETGRLPSEVLCEHRGHRARTAAGGETDECTLVRGEIADDVGITPTRHLHLLLTDPRTLARLLLTPLGETPEQLGWEREEGQR